MVYRLSNGILTVGISDLGAEIVSVMLDGKERVWQNESGIWNRRCPILFPVCGRSAVTVCGKSYPMPRHGFARDSLFDVRRVSKDSVTFVLKSSERTLAVYPYPFEFAVTYTLQERTVTVKNEIKNVGEREMPFALGRHDSFLLDRRVGDCALCFSEEERFLSRQTDDGGRLTDLYDDLGKGNVLPLPESLLRDGHSVILENVKSDSAILVSAEGDPIASIRFEGIKNIVLWRPGDAQMICVEPWSALPDSADADHEFPGKPGIFALQSGEQKEIVVELRYD